MKLVYDKCDIFPISDMIIWISNIILYKEKNKRVINLKVVKRRTITGINVYTFFIPFRLDWICSLGARCRLWTNLNEWGGSERSPNRGRCPTVRRSLSRSAHEYTSFKVMWAVIHLTDILIWYMLYKSNQYLLENQKLY